ncbi:MAG: hypothetical protein FJ247_14225, partial [Nitrospira sp.]|nr:hypothetical protein [Nitrospira sp.]
MQHNSAVGNPQNASATMGQASRGGSKKNSPRTIDKTAQMPGEGDVASPGRQNTKPAKAQPEKSEQQIAPADQIQDSESQAEAQPSSSLGESALLTPFESVASSIHGEGSSNFSASTLQSFSASAQSMGEPGSAGLSMGSLLASLTSSVSATKSAAVSPTVDNGDSGVVADGHIANAMVFRDTNNNGLWDHESFTDTNNNGFYDAGETFVDANSDGRFTAESFAITNSQGQFTGLTGTGKVIATSLRDTNGNVLSKDVSTGLAFNQVYSAPDGASVLNPLTSLVAARVGANASAADIAAAEQAVAQALGITLPTGTSLSSYDPIAIVNSTTATAAEKSAALESQKVATQIANTIAVLTAAAVGADSSLSSSAAAATVLSSIASVVASTGSSDFSSSATLAAITNQLATTVGGSTQTALQTQSASISTALSNVNTLISQVNASTASGASLVAIANIQEVAQSTLVNTVQNTTAG